MSNLSNFKYAFTCRLIIVAQSESIKLSANFLKRNQQRLKKLNGFYSAYSIKKGKFYKMQIDLPDFGAGLLWSSIAFSKKRLRSDTDLGTLAEAGGDCRRNTHTQVDKYRTEIHKQNEQFAMTESTSTWNKSKREENKTIIKHEHYFQLEAIHSVWFFYLSINFSVQ